MPASPYIYELARVLMGDPAADGGMSTTLTEVFSDTVLGSAIITTAEGTTTNINVEEKTDAIISSTQEGAMSFTFQTYNCSAQALLAAFGGTVTGDGSALAPFSWNAPAKNAQPEKSVRFETPSGQFIEFPRAKLANLMNITFSKQDAGKVTINGTVLAPTKAGLSKARRSNL